MSDLGQKQRLFGSACEPVKVTAHYLDRVVSAKSLRDQARIVLALVACPLIVALGSMLVALPLSAFAQRERGPLRLEERRLEKRTPPRPQAFGGRVYRGRLAWRDGRWHHALRNGRDGWWWDVGGYWYFYPEQIEGSPDYVSNVEVAADDVIAAPSPPPPQELKPPSIIVLVI